MATTAAGAATTTATSGSTLLEVPGATNNAMKPRASTMGLDAGGLEPNATTTGIDISTLSADDHSREQRILERRVRLEARRIQKTNESKKGASPVAGSGKPGGGAGAKDAAVTAAILSAAQAANGIVVESKAKNQVESSKKVLDAAKNNAYRVVTNVKVAVQSRESVRRVDESKKMAGIRQKKLDEAGKALSMEVQLAPGWDPVRAGLLPSDPVAAVNAPKNPYALTELLEKQRQACSKLVELKNHLIADYENELKIKDEDYVKEIKRQSGEIDSLLERMAVQRKEIRVALAQELDLIEQAFMQERNELLGKFLQETDQFMETRRQNEGKYLESNVDRIENHIQQLKDLRVQDTEDYNLTKVKLETDVQVLEQQLSQMRATYQLNSEKLEYNFQVLKKRDEENNVTITTQKRKINRLNDSVNALRAKYQKQEDGYHKEYHQLSDDYKRIMEQFTELQKKFRRFRTLDDKKYSDLWQMNEEEAQEHLRKIVAADRVIWEQQLATGWSIPATFARLLDWDHQGEDAEALLRSNGMGGSGTNKDANGEPKQNIAEIDGKPRKLSSSFTQQQLEDLMNTDSLKQVLDLLTSESSSFLVEEKLHRLLQPLRREEQTLMKLDSIFKALNIHSTRDVERLQSYFLAEAKDDVNQIALIHPNEVIRAIRRFIKREPLHLRAHTSAVKGAPSFGDQPESTEGATGVEAGEDQKFAFWKAVEDAIQPQKFHVWDLVYESMKSYNQLLNDRFKTKNEVEELAAQNEELKQLLNQYLQAEVNNDLVVPPIKILFPQDDQLEAQH